MSTIQPYTAADLARLRSVQVRPQGWSNATRDQVRELRHPDTRELMKIITDQLGNRTRMRRDGQDVRILAPHVRVRAVTQEVR